MSLLDAREAQAWTGGPSFSLGNRLYRAAWAVCWALLASWTPPQAAGWRRLLLRLFGARMGRGSKVYSSVRIWSPRNLEMQEYAAVAPGAILYAMAPITIGAYAIVSQRAHLCAGTHDIEDANFQLRARPITIGARAWIAAEAFVGPGVSIGEGAVLGARGCATKDLDSWTVYAGNPCQAIKPRKIRFD